MYWEYEEQGDGQVIISDDPNKSHVIATLQSVAAASALVSAHNVALDNKFEDGRRYAQDGAESMREDR